jgi:hypothetical protein
MRHSAAPSAASSTGPRRDLGNVHGHEGTGQLRQACRWAEGVSHDERDDAEAGKGVQAVSLPGYSGESPNPSSGVSAYPAPGLATPS